MGGDNVSGLDSESDRGGSYMVERKGNICWKCYCGSTTKGDGEGEVLSLPPGYRFKPNDEELVGFYLKNKVLGEPLPWHNVRIFDVDFYAYLPESLTKKYQPWGDETWFFFNHRDRKYKNGKRPNRAAAGGLGYWKATGADQQIAIGWDVEGDQKPLGARKSLVFYEGKPMRGVKTNWIMQEFRIDGLEQNTRTRTEDNMRLDDWVLSKVYKKKRRRSDHDSDQDEEAEPGGVKQAKRKTVVSGHIQAKRPGRKMARAPAVVPVNKDAADHMITSAKPAALISMPCVRQFLNLDQITTSELDYTGLYNNIINNNTDDQMLQPYGTSAGRLDHFPLQPLMMADNESLYSTVASYMGSAISQQNVNNPLNIPSLLRPNIVADYGALLSQLARSNQGIGHTNTELIKGFGTVSNPQEDPIGENDENVVFDYLS